ncbi:MAG TPA: ABC transporter ATP-binding protein [Chloroflexota bacterium]|jgi:ABC-type sugar transport system ATPase subunit|nr:ABC transporter ATP-binding protein [Chloroflexota bacterium]
MAAITLRNVSKTFHGGRAAAMSQARAFEAADQGALGRGRVDPPQASGEGGVRALDDVDLEIRDGETVSVIGPSGCGKSTLLRVIAGLETADSGQVLYDGQDMHDVKPGDRGIGMVFQNYALYPHMESRGNLSFFFRVRHREPEIDERVQITAEIMGVGFDQLLDRKPKTLSGGQQQRVAIARCIVRDPKVFLFDEPLSNLDARLRQRTRVEVKRLLARFKITAVYVTHDQTEALALADRIAVMRQGRIEQFGPYDEVRDRPLNAFVAGFVGTPPASFLPARVADGRLALAGATVPLPSSWRGLARPGQELLVGLRDEHVTLAPPGAIGDLQGVVEVIEPLLAERQQLLHVRLADGAEITARVDAETRVARGDRVPLALDRAGLLAFDAATERNLLLP